MNTSPSYWYTILQNNISTNTNNTFIHYNLHLRLTNFWGGFFINGGGVKQLIDSRAQSHRLMMIHYAMAMTAGTQTVDCRRDGVHLIKLPFLKGCSSWWVH